MNAPEEYVYGCPETNEHAPPHPLMFVSVMGFLAGFDPYRAYALTVADVIECDPATHDVALVRLVMELLTMQGSLVQGQSLKLVTL